MPLLVVILYLVCLALICRKYWRNFRRANRNKPFNYRITDIWAAMAGLTPSMALIAAHYRAGVLSEPGPFWTLASLLAISQIAGLFIGRVHIEIPPHRGAKNAFDSAVSIVTGALLGILILVFLPVALVICLGTLALLFSVPVLGMGVLSFVVLMVLFMRAGKQKPPYFPRRKDGWPGNGS